MEEHEEVAPSKANHYRRQDAVALPRWFFGHLEEELEDRVAEETASYVKAHNALVSNRVFADGLDEHCLASSNSL